METKVMDISLTEPKILKALNIVILNEPKLKPSDMGYNGTYHTRKHGGKLFTKCFQRVQKIYKPERVSTYWDEKGVEREITIPEATSFRELTCRKPFDDANFYYENSVSTWQIAITNTKGDEVPLRNAAGVNEPGEPYKPAETDAATETYVHYNALNATWHIIYQDLERYHPTRKLMFYFPLEVYQEQRGRYLAKISLAYIGDKKD